MGLDSVELLMEVEKYFGISIPDAEAEKIYTVQTMADAVATHLDITSDSMELRDKIFQKIVAGIQALGLANKQIELSDPISNYIPSDNKATWSVLQESLGLLVPKPDIIKSGGNKISDKLKSLLQWAPSYDWQQITVERFIAALCANNYQVLLENKNIQTKYEIYIAVVGITVDKIGVDYYEVTPEKSFTTDLGVD